MVNIPIVFEPKHKIGDIVFLKVNPEHKMVIDFYRLIKISDSGEVIYFNYNLYDENGASYTFHDDDLISVEQKV